MIPNTANRTWPRSIFQWLIALIVVWLGIGFIYNRQPWYGLSLVAVGCFLTWRACNYTDELLESRRGLKL